MYYEGHDYGHDDHHDGYGGHDDHHDDHHGGYDEHPVGGYKEHEGHDYHRRIDSLGLGRAPRIPVYYGNRFDNTRQDSKIYSSLNSIFPDKVEKGYMDPFYGYEGDNIFYLQY